MRRKKILNLLMVIAIMLTVFSGIMIVGHVKGWFGEKTAFGQMGGSEKDSSRIAITTLNKKGGCNIERRGIAYGLENDTNLRDGDVIKTLNGASIDVEFGDTTISFGENSEAIFHIDDAVQVNLCNGEMFISAPNPIQISLLNTVIPVESGVFHVSAPYGSAQIHVLKNEITINDKVVKAGESLSIASNEIEIKKLQVEELNDFCVEKMLEMEDGTALCIAREELERVEEDRKAMKEASLHAKLMEDEVKQSMDSSDDDREDSHMKGSSQNSEKGAGNAPDSSVEDNNNVAVKKYCTMFIQCNSILDNMENLKEGKEQFVPANGVILSISKIGFEEGDTVFDVLKKACNLAGIQMEYSWNPLYDSNYIEGINQLYEFDCGAGSGWKYKVNGWEPNYGCSSYTIKEGDSIEWYFTCGN